MGPNTFTTRSTYGGRLIGALLGVPIGILLLVGACVLIYWNEGRVDYSKIASKSTPVDSSQVSQAENGQFISVTGPLSSSPPLGDGAYLQPGQYVAVHRLVEEYSWVEQQQTNNNTTTYTYTEEWTDNPADSSNFHDPQGHQNPPKALDDTTIRASSAKVGAYPFDPQTITLPSMQSITLTTSDTTLPSQSATPGPLSHLTLASTQYIYGGAGSLAAPQIGDIRISYEAVDDGTTATVFGLLNNGTLNAYTDPHNHTIYDLLMGDRQTAISTLHTQYESSLWIFRGLGILMIWIGLMMILSPLDALIDFIPIIGEIGKAIIAAITLPVALITGITMILISYSLHHIWALVIALVIMLGLFIGLFKLIKKIRKIPPRNSQPSPQLVQVTQQTAPTSENLFPNQTTQVSQAQPTTSMQPTPVQTPLQTTAPSVQPHIIAQPEQPQINTQVPVADPQSGSLFTNTTPPNVVNNQPNPTDPTNQNSPTQLPQ